MFKGLRSFPLKMRIFSALFARAMACATSGALLAIVGVLALCATPVFGQNGSRSWTGNTSTDFYDGDNWSAAGNYPNGNVTFVDSALTGSANTTINRTSGTYSYIYGLLEWTEKTGPVVGLWFPKTKETKNEIKKIYNRADNQSVTCC